MSDETRTSLANRALDILGRGPTGNIDTAKGELEKRLLASLQTSIDEMLRLHKWPAAKASIEIPGSTLNNDDYAYEIALPADVASVWRVGGLEDGWERRSGQGAGSVVTNLTPPVRVHYARRLEPEQMTAEMFEVAAAILADKVKQHAALSTARRQEVTLHLREMIVRGARVAGSEDGPDTPFSSPWLDAMLGL